MAKHSAPQITLTLCESERMSELENALEYVLNTADGCHYVLYGEPITDDRKIDAARELLPAVKWRWVQRT